MKKTGLVVVIVLIALVAGASKFTEAQTPKAGAAFLGNTGYSSLSAIFQDSVTRWDPVSSSNMSFGRMTMYENRNSKKITWRSGQSSAYETISEDEGGTLIHLLSAPNFDGDRCRYLKMVFNEDSVTVDFYTTKSAVDQNKFFMEGTYEQVK